ncbi:MAG: TonB-dependent receptor [Calditrichae bacterium]|nr:TonB-dependent receptor [Calditrichota bacterium]MCB9057623.1 TonB-dependent receptor [Calditrichia bacterium]
MKHLKNALILLLFTTVYLFAGTTGKIAGEIKDSKTGEPLPGVNVYLDGTALGAATDIEGYYVILNVPPGKYTLKVVNIGYKEKTFLDVRVNIDQTTTIDVDLQEESLELGEEITVVATRPVVEKDVAASRANISAEEIESLPIASVDQVVGLQAGIEGLSIRGGGTDEVAFIADGFVLRDERNNTPYTGLSLTSIEEIQVQAGGFTAEYGNIRSGVINVVTKEGSRENYDFSFIGRYRAAAPKNFGQSPSDPNSYWMRPYLDEDVAWTGTKNGAWSTEMQAQYPEFAGWIAISEQTLADDNPDNDLTPQAAQRLFLWQHRRELDIKDPDYDLDYSFGGPVPFISKDLGNLRFHTSYRTTQNMYMIPLSDNGYRDYNWQLKLTSDLGGGDKIVVSTLLGRQTGTASSRAGAPGLFNSAWQIGAQLNRVSYIDARIYSDSYWSESRVNYNSIGVKYTNIIDENSFYDLTLNRFASDYDTGPPRRRDNTLKYLFGNNYYTDEAPLGFEPLLGVVGIDGSMRMGIGFSNAYDTSFIATYTGKIDYTNQFNRFNQFKAGLELNITDSRMNYARYDAVLHDNDARTNWERTPVRGAMYIQDKLEFEGMIATLGLRMDYFNAGGDWYEGYNPYDPALSAALSSGIDTLVNKKSTDQIFTLSPRLAIAFPITENSKLYFNYGHFRQLPTPENLFILRRNSQGGVEQIANPNNPLPKTVAYELGYEHSLFDEYLIRTAGYYKDISDQPRLVTYSNFDQSVSYSISEPNSYEDIRGFELTINKNRGPWFQGFVNYTYQVSTSGNFGLANNSENPVEQRRNERDENNYYQSKPIPRPYARANINLFTPLEYGPQLGGIFPLGDLQLNVLADWKAGNYLTWTGGGGTIPGIQYNVQWTDYWNVRLRFSKAIKIASANIELFVDFENALNFKRLSTYGFIDGNDYLAYMKSLHLSKDTDGFDKFSYVAIPGDDRPGDYRANGADFVPITAFTDRNSFAETPKDGYYYYEASTEKYLVYSNDAGWQDADKSKINKILDDKAYIDMPNQHFLNFLDPRNIFWGMKISFSL